MQHMEHSYVSSGVTDHGLSLTMSLGLATTCTTTEEPAGVCQETWPSAPRPKAIEVYMSIKGKGEYRKPFGSADSVGGGAQYTSRKANPSELFQAILPDGDVRRGF